MIVAITRSAICSVMLSDSLFPTPEADLTSFTFCPRVHRRETSAKILNTRTRRTTRSRRVRRPAREPTRAARMAEPAPIWLANGERSMSMESVPTRSITSITLP